MKKVIFVSIICGFLFVDFVPAKSSTRKIHVLLSAANRYYEEGLIGLRSVIQSEPKIYYIDVIESETEDISGFFKNLERQKPLLVITFGLKASRMAQRYLKKTPIMFSLVSDTKSLKVDSNNICGVVSKIKIQEYFRILKEINPRIKNVYTFYSTKSGHFQASEGDYQNLQFNFMYRKIEVKQKNDFQKVLNQLPRNVDAIYMINDSLYDRVNFKLLSDYCKKNHIILMTGYSPLLRAGATISLSPDYDELGVKSGKLANQIISREVQCRQGPFLFPRKPIFSYNRKYAIESKVNIPPEIAERARFNKIFSKGILFLNSGKVKSAKIIFESLAKSNPANKDVKFYLEKATEKTTSKQTTPLLREANKLLQRGEYAKARRYYRQILKLNPNLGLAKKNLQKSIQLQSEREFGKGKAQLARKKIFAAFRAFKRAVAISSANNKARQKIIEIKRSQQPKVPSMIKSGIGHYNKRKYRVSMTIFDNVLLLFPSNKKAVEYKRLTKKKLEALTKLMNCRKRKNKECSLLWQK